MYAHTMYSVCEFTFENLLYFFNSRIWWLVETSKCTMKTIFTRKDKNCCNEKFVSVSNDNEFQLIHTLYCFSLFLFVMLSVFIALKHSTLNVSYLKKKNRSNNNNINLKKKSRNLKESHRFFNCISQFQLNSVWTTLSIAFLVITATLDLYLGLFLFGNFSFFRVFSSRSFARSLVIFLRFVFLFHARAVPLLRVSLSQWFSRVLCMYVRLSIRRFYFYLSLSLSVLSRCLSFLNCDTLNSNWLIVVIICVNGYA